MSDLLPDPQLTLVYRLEAVLGEPLELGEVSQGRRRIVPQIGGTFEGPHMKGKLLPGVSADWQIERLGRGEDVDASEYTFRTSTQIETASRELAWLNKGVFISVGGRRAGGVIYETYLVG
jgi:hypothetical protein